MNPLEGTANFALDFLVVSENLLPEQLKQMVPCHAHTGTASLNDKLGGCD